MRLQQQETGNNVFVVKKLESSALKEPMPSDVISSSCFGFHKCGAVEGALFSGWPRATARPTPRALAAVTVDANYVAERSAHPSVAVPAVRPECTPLDLPISARTRQAVKLLASEAPPFVESLSPITRGAGLPRKHQ